MEDHQTNDAYQNGLPLDPVPGIMPLTSAPGVRDRARVSPVIREKAPLTYWTLGRLKRGCLVNRD